MPRVNGLLATFLKYLSASASTDLWRYINILLFIIIIIIIINKLKLYKGNSPSNFLGTRHYVASWPW